MLPVFTHCALLTWLKNPTYMCCSRVPCEFMLGALWFQLMQVHVANASAGMRCMLNGAM